MDSRLRTSAGPFLRYQNILPGTATWTGSLLVLTRPAGSSCRPAAAGGEAGVPSATLPGAAAATGTPPASDSCNDCVPGAIPAPVAAPAPRLVVEDSWTETGHRDAVEAMQPTLLDTCLGWHFWHYDLRFELGRQQRPVAYAVHWGGGALPERFQFWLPAAGVAFHAAYYSCNGFSSSIPQNAPERQDPQYMWRDLLQVHEAFPMHVLIGGGDQLYNDGVWKSPSLAAWTGLDARTEKLAAAWVPAMEEEASDFFCHNYIHTFMLDSVRQAFASIPSVMMWDDHDIWDGWGSYPSAMQDCPVFQGLFGVAKRFYLLFQQHTTQALNEQKQELFGDGEFHFLKSLGPEVALAGLDMRTKRRKECILPQASYDLLEQQMLALPGSVRHLIVMTGVPLVFPRLPLVEEAFETVACMGKSSRLIRNMARNTGLMDPYVGAQPEILDDLIDGMTATIHTEERLRFIRLLQGLAEQRGFRVTVLSGDAHVGGLGRLYSRPKIKDLSQDPLYMPQVISSAIMNGPPPEAIFKLLHRFNFAKNVDGRTREKMVRLFKGPFHPSFHKLLNCRNWCDVSMQAPPYISPMHPEDSGFGALRFSLRCENAKRRKGHAEEVYNIVVPRLLVQPQHKAAGAAATAAGAAVGRQPAPPVPHAEGTAAVGGAHEAGAPTLGHPAGRGAGDWSAEHARKAFSPTSAPGPPTPVLAAPSPVGLVVGGEADGKQV